MQIAEDIDALERCGRSGSTDWLSRPSFVTNPKKKDARRLKPEDLPRVLLLCRHRFRRLVKEWQNNARTLNQKQRAHLEVQAELDERIAQAQRPSTIPADLERITKAQDPSHIPGYRDNGTKNPAIPDDLRKRYVDACNDLVADQTASERCAEELVDFQLPEGEEGDILFEVDDVEEPDDDGIVEDDEDDEDDEDEFTTVDRAVETPGTGTGEASRSGAASANVNEAPHSAATVDEDGPPEPVAAEVKTRLSPRERLLALAEVKFAFFKRICTVKEPTAICDLCVSDPTIDE